MIGKGQANEREKTMNALNNNPTKAQELAHWESFVATLPKGSYLADYLDGSTDILRGEMSSDMGLNLIAEILRCKEQARRDADEAMQRLKKLAEEHAKMARELADMTRQKKMQLDYLEDIANAANTIAVQVRDCRQRTK
jgi:hypothetical protein